MRILVCAHHHYAGLGCFRGPLAGGSHDIVEWSPGERPPPVLTGFGALIVLGGRARVADHDAHPWLEAEKTLVRDALRRATPVLGVCLGAQVLAVVTGGAVQRASESEIGWHEIKLTPSGAADPVLGILPRRFRAFEWHHDEVLLPPDGVALARSTTCLQAFTLRHRPAWGVQFHPEATSDNLATWLQSWRTDPAAVATGLNPNDIRRDTAESINRSNALGRAIIERFLTRAGAAQQGALHDPVTDRSAHPAV